MLRGSLTIVVGSVGAGKSSLLAAMLGEMAALQGSVAVRGGTAYTQQDSWIQVQLAGPLHVACCMRLLPTALFQGRGARLGRLHAGPSPRPTPLHTSPRP